MKGKRTDKRDAGWRWGAQNTLTVGSQKGGVFKFFNFLFQVLSFVKLWALGLCCLCFKGSGMGFKGIVSLTPLLVSTWCPPQGISQLQHQFSHIWCCPWAQLAMGRIQRGKQDAVTGTAWPAFLHLRTALPEEH